MRLSEIYASSQGEGPNVGKTTVFVRFGGCNLRCAGWACDTPHAIFPSYRNDWTKYTVDELTDAVMKQVDMVGAEWITLTGGEPFLQPKPELEQFVLNMNLNGVQVEAFSNGTIEYPDWAIENVNFIMDWKLPGSGEVRFGPTNPTRLDNLAAMQRHLERCRLYRASSVEHAVKFVIKDALDLQAAHGLWLSCLKNAASHVEVFYGKVWEGELSNAELVEYVMKNGLPWRLNVQLHNMIWPVNERGR